MKEIIKLSLTLGLICFAAAAVVTSVNDLTEEARKRTESRQLQDALNVVLPDFTNQPQDTKIEVPVDDDQSVAFYRAKRDSDIVGVAGTGVSPEGYGGDVRVLVGLHVDGDIRAVTVTAHEETPGLGTTVTDRKERRSIWSLLTPSGDEKASPGEDNDELPPNRYLDQYSKNGHNAANAPFQVKKEGGQIQAVSGATISSRAVADAVSQVCTAFQKHRERILTTP